jgi:hypothetical protein
LISSNVISGSVTANGQPLTVAVSKPGQSVLLTFSGTAGDKMRLLIGNVSIPQSDVSIQNPDSSVLVASSYFAQNSIFWVDTPILSTTGTYTISQAMETLDQYAPPSAFTNNSGTRRAGHTGDGADDALAHRALPLDR